MPLDPGGGVALEIAWSSPGQVAGGVAHGVPVRRLRNRGRRCRSPRGVMVNGTRSSTSDCESRSDTWIPSLGESILWVRPVPTDAASSPERADHVDDPAPGDVALEREASVSISSQAAAEISCEFAMQVVHGCTPGWGYGRWWVRWLSVQRSDAGIRRSGRSSPSARPLRWSSRPSVGSAGAAAEPPGGGGSSRKSPGGA